MNSTLAVAARELSERWRICLISAGLAVMPFVAALLPTSRGHRTEMIPIVGGFIGISMALGVAVALGSTIIVGDLAQRRLSFYFSRPVSASALWIGKVTASLLTSVLVFVIIAGPAGLVRKSSQWQWISGLDVFLAVCAAIVVLFFFSHGVSTMVRSRSAVLGIDFLLLMVTVGAFAAMAKPLLFGGAFEMTKTVAVTVGALIVAAMAIAPFWQLQNGRSDIVRSHAAFSRAFWPMVALILAGAGAFTWWVVSARPSDVSATWEVLQPSSGNAFYVAGHARNRGEFVASFIVDEKSGEFERLGAMGWWGLRFSRNGRMAAWVGPGNLLRGGRTGELFLRETAQLNRGDASTGLRFTSPSFVLSDDGSRIAVVSAEGTAVYDTASRKLLASTASLKFDYRNGLYFYFAGSDLVRFVTVGRRDRAGAAEVPVRIYELDVPARTFRQTGERITAPGTPMISASEDGSRILLRGSGEVLDGRTGALLMRYEKEALSALSFSLLRDGSLATFVREADGAHFQIVDASGALRQDVRVPNVNGAYIAAETSDGMIIASMQSKKPGDLNGRSMIVIDPRQGAVVRTLPGLRGPIPTWGPDPRLAVRDADAWLAGTDAEGRLVFWNAKSGARKEMAAIFAARDGEGKLAFGTVKSAMPAEL